MARLLSTTRRKTGHLPLPFTMPLYRSREKTKGILMVAMGSRYMAIWFHLSRRRITSLTIKKQNNILQERALEKKWKHSLLGFHIISSTNHLVREAESQDNPLIQATPFSKDG